MQDLIKDHSAILLSQSNDGNLYIIHLINNTVNKILQEYTKINNMDSNESKDKYKTNIKINRTLNLITSIIDNKN